MILKLIYMSLETFKLGVLYMVLNCRIRVSHGIAKLIPTNVTVTTNLVEVASSRHRRTSRRETRSSVCHMIILSSAFVSRVATSSGHPLIATYRVITEENSN